MSPETAVTTHDVPPCGRCNGPGLLAASFASSWTNQSGAEVTGLREAVLCPQCDRDDPAAAELIALFTVDDALTPQNLPTFTELIDAWVVERERRRVDLDALADEEERWRRGEL